MSEEQVKKTVKQGGKRKECQLYFEPPSFIICRTNKRMRLFLSKEFFEWVQEHGLSIISKSFIGWFYHIRGAVYGVVSITGRMFIHSESRVRKMNVKRCRKVILKCIDNGMFKEYTDDVYPEFAHYNNIKMDCKYAEIIEDDKYKCFNDGYDYTDCYDFLKDYLTTARQLAEKLSKEEAK